MPPKSVQYRHPSGPVSTTFGWTPPAKYRDRIIILISGSLLSYCTIFASAETHAAWRKDSCDDRVKTTTGHTLLMRCRSGRQPNTFRRDDSHCGQQTLTPCKILVYSLLFGFQLYSPVLLKGLWSSVLLKENLSFGQGCRRGIYR